MKLRNPFVDSAFRLTSTYGVREIDGTYSVHKGIDLVGITSRDVCSVADGTVVSSTIVTDKNDLTWQWGNYVCVQGDDGKYIYYCHLMSRAVIKGDRVKAGQKIGVMGNTGYSFGAHLHFEVRLGDRRTAVDPCIYLGIENKVGVYDLDATVPVTPPAGEDTPASNVPGVSEWAYEAVEWAIRSDILRGNAKPDGTVDYKLRDSCTREEIAVFLYRFLEYLESEEGNAI